MALSDHYDEADVLDTLSWVILDIPARIKRLANLYLANEDDMRDAHRKYAGPTKGTVRFFVKSVYMPPRGQGALTVEGVLAEIPRQRAIQEERAKRQPWTWEKLRLRERRNNVAKYLYSIWCKPRWGDKKKERGDINCVGITTVAGVKLVVDRGGYRVQPRLYMRQIATNKVKVVVLEGANVDTIYEALTRLAPQEALLGSLDGKPLTLDFEDQGFLMEGWVHPWENVQRVYIGKKQAHRTWGNPKRKTD